MIEERTFRFLIPPLLFLGSLLTIMILDKDFQLLRLVIILGSKDAKELSAVVLGVVTAGSVSIMTAGFLFSQIGVFCMRIVFLGYRIFRIINKEGTQTFEVGLDTASTNKIVARLNLQNNATVTKPIEILAAGAWFDHGYLRKNESDVHDWIRRRFDHFVLNVNCVAAIVASLPVWFAILFQMDESSTLWFHPNGKFSFHLCSELSKCPDVIWIAIVLVLTLVLLSNAWIARRQAMAMLNLQASRS